MKLDLSKIISASFNTLFRNNVVLAVVIIGAALSGFLILQIQAATAGSTVENLGAYLETVALSYGLLVLFGVFFAGMIISATFYGNRIEIGDAAKISVRRYLHLLATQILYTIIVVLGFIALIIPGIYLLFRLILATPIVVLEKRNPLEALSRSWKLMKGNMWRVIAIMVVLAIIVGIINVAFYLLSFFFKDQIVQFVSGFVSTFFSYLYIIATVQVYRQLRGSSKRF